MNRKHVLMFATAALSLAFVAPRADSAPAKTTKLPAASASVALVQDGQARAVIVVAPETMAPDNKKLSFRSLPSELAAERGRLLVRESVRDLALYFEKMSGANVEITTTSALVVPEVVPPKKPAAVPEVPFVAPAVYNAATDKRIPIYIGAAATEKFGPMTFKDPAQQGFRVVVRPDGIGLMGENEQATSFAIYEVLERLGVRWMMPTEMGEVIPSLKTIALAPGDTSSAPGTEARYIWHLDSTYLRRIRNGGKGVGAGHTLEVYNKNTKDFGYLSTKQLEDNPDWNAMMGGKRSVNGRFCWGNPQVSDAIADKIIALRDAGGPTQYSLSPQDGSNFCECPLDKALDSGDYDPMMDQVSITDRFINFSNRIATRVVAKHPDTMFGFLAYVQYTQPPTREKLHPNLKVQLAPINYCRAHSIADNCASRQLMGRIVEGWGKASSGISYYQYMFNLAEYTAPYPMLRQMTVELPFIYKNNVKYWQPEGMTNLDQILPAHYVSNKMAWNPKDDPQRILDEFFTLFYGSAAAPMRRYWTQWDDAWIKVDEHAGANWAYPRRFTPEFMKTVRALMDEALAAARTPQEKARVEMQNENLKQITLFMKLRWDLNEGRLENLGPESKIWLDRQIELGNEYQPQGAFSKIRWTPRTAGGHWFYAYMQPPYLDASRISENHKWISAPLRNWKWMKDTSRAEPKIGEKSGWHKPDFNDADWKTTDVGIETWDTMGIANFYGPVFYRMTVPVKEVPAGKKTWLWISATDGAARIWVNGQPIEYLNEKGEPILDRAGKKVELFNGYGKSVSFDISKAIKPNADNQITIEATHTFINELGTGGLLGPVYLYQEK